MSQSQELQLNNNLSKLRNGTYFDQSNKRHIPKIILHTDRTDI